MAVQRKKHSETGNCTTTCTVPKISMTGRMIKRPSQEGRMGIGKEWVIWELLEAQ
jgi:hypothetical protein